MAARKKLNPGRAKAGGGRDAHAELAAALSVEVPARLGAGKARSALARLRTSQDLDDLLDQLQAVEPELREAVAEAALVDKPLARVLSKLADIASMADILSEDDILARLEFFRQRA